MMFDEEFAKRQEYINQVLDAYLPVVEGQQKTVLDAMNYSVCIGGKRIRPILMLEIFRSFQTEEEEERLEPFLAAIEMLHTYSLVHDDLPAMDNDKYRRGQLTTHVKYGEAMGILAGDALLNYSFETACKAFSMDHESDWNLRVAKAMKLFSMKAGIFGMIGGQVVDVEKTGQALAEDEIAFIYELKTCALIEAAMLIGAVLGGATETQLQEIEVMASDIGHAFQIQDDILDMEGDEKVLGKTLHSDEKNGKTTYVSLHGITASKEKVVELSNEAKSLAKNLNHSEFLCELIEYLTKRQR